MPKNRLRKSPFWAAVILVLLPQLSLAQSAISSSDCNHVTIHGTAKNNVQSGEIDWLALTNQADPYSNQIDTSEGCLLDTESVRTKNRIASEDNGASIDDFVHTDAEVYKSGSSRGTDKDKSSQPFSSEEEFARRNLFDAIQNQAPLTSLLFTLVPLSLFGGALFFVFNAFKNSKKTTARRFTCKIPAAVNVDGKSFSGRIMRFGPTSCQFVPDSTSGADAIAGILMRIDVPDFDLQVGKLSLPIIPETPGSRFTAARQTR